MRFEFATTPRIVFGRGTAARIAPLAASLGTRALLVSGGSLRRAESVLPELERLGVPVARMRVLGEPTTEQALEGLDLARANRCDVVLAIGGGSALDLGKSIAALLTNGGEPLDYLEVIGRGRALTVRSAPMLAVPTTAGTGSEATHNAVLQSVEHRVKVSLRGALMLPHVAVVDPELTQDAPPDVTASTGLDAFTQLLEPFVSRQSSPITDALCREGLPRAARSLARAWRDGADLEAREDMSMASLLGGMSLANAKLGAVHGFAGPLGGFYRAPHGMLCASLLPGVVDMNVRALREREPGSPTLGRYREAAALITGNPEATVEQGAAWIRRLCQELRVPPLRELGAAEADFPALVRQARKSSSMQGNPIELTEAELTEVLRQAF